MPSLNDQLNSFKAKMRSAPVLGKRVADRQPQLPRQQSQNASDNTGATNETIVETESKRRRVYSQPVSTGAGQHRNTQLVHAIDYLRKAEAPVTLQDLEAYLSSPVEPLIPLMRSNPHLYVAMRDKTVTYVSKLGVYSADELLRYLASQETFQGVPVRDLKDGWNGCIPTIKRLEEEHKILVLRNKKDNQPRLVWLNAIPGAMHVDPKFTQLWQTTRVPSAADLPRNLERVGLKPSSVDPASIKHEPRNVPEKKHRRAPRAKITNTHLRGILKDFS